MRADMGSGWVDSRQGSTRTDGGGGGHPGGGGGDLGIPELRLAAGFVLRLEPAFPVQPDGLVRNLEGLPAAAHTVLVSWRRMGFARNAAFSNISTLISHLANLKASLEHLIWRCIR